MEVHKTAGQGWAVRATVDIHRGKVVGIFTGLVSSFFLSPKLTVVVFASELLCV